MVTTSRTWYGFPIVVSFLELFAYIMHALFRDAKKVYRFHFLLTKIKHCFVIKYLIIQRPLQTSLCCVTFYSTTNTIAWGLSMTGCKENPFSIHAKVILMMTQIQEIFVLSSTTIRKINYFVYMWVLFIKVCN